MRDIDVDEIMKMDNNSKLNAFADILYEIYQRGTYLVDDILEVSCFNNGLLIIEETDDVNTITNKLKHAVDELNSSIFKGEEFLLWSEINKDILSAIITISIFI